MTGGSGEFTHRGIPAGASFQGIDHGAPFPSSADNQHYRRLTSAAALPISCRSCGLLGEALEFGRPVSFLDLPDVSGVLLCAGCFGFVGLVA